MAKNESTINIDSGPLSPLSNYTYSSHATDSLLNSPTVVLKDHELQGQAKKAQRARRVRILRLTQSTLSALLSLLIAIFQGQAYLTYSRTKNMPGMWPKVPDLLPTILLLVVALAALIFDICMIVAYVWPNGYLAQQAFKVGSAAHSVAVSAKSVSYALTAIVCRGGFNQGQNSGQNADLWSYTCSAKGQKQLEDVTNAHMDCNQQWVAWIFALAQLGLQGLEWLITMLIQRNETPQKKPASPQELESMFTAYDSEVNGKLQDITPKFQQNMA